MLLNAYFLAKFRFDTAENEPAKNLQKLKICKNLNFANSVEAQVCRCAHLLRVVVAGRLGREAGRVELLLQNLADSRPSKKKNKTLNREARDP